MAAPLTATALGPSVSPARFELISKVAMQWYNRIIQLESHLWAKKFAFTFAIMGQLLRG